MLDNIIICGQSLAIICLAISHIQETVNFRRYAKDLETRLSDFDLRLHNLENEFVVYAKTIEALEDEVF